MASEVSSGQSFVPLETAQDVKARREQVLSQYKTFKDALAARRAALLAGLSSQNFLRNAAELEKWIAERMQQTNDGNGNDTANLEIHMQKHSSLELEVNANAGTLSKLDEEGAEVIAEDSLYKDLVDNRLAELHRQWNELLEALKLRGVQLRKTKAWVSFYRKCDEVLYWIIDKETIVTSTDTGHDLDHVTMLQGKFDEFMSELQAYGDRIKDVNNDAEQMVNEQKHPETENIQEKQTKVNEAWENLNRKAEKRKLMLIAASEVHRFNRDVTETVSWIKEKESLLDSEDVGADVASVQALQRVHQGAERDLAALQEKVNALCAEADRLEKEHGDVSVAGQRQEVVDNWERLNKVAGARKERLQQSYDLQMFLSECRELIRWADDIESRITADELATDVAGAEMLVDRHQEHRGEIGAQESSFGHANNFGQRLINDGHPASSTVVVEVLSTSSSCGSDVDEPRSVPTITTEGPGIIQETLEELNRRRNEVLQVWGDRQALYDQCLHLALFNRDAEQAESWMTTQEVIAAQDDLGDSLDAVQTLRRKHDDFARSVVAQEEKIKSVGEVADRLVDRDHYAAEDIGKRRDALFERHRALKQSIEARQVALEDARKLRSYQRDARNLCSWIDERRKTARDECYQDPTNIRGKLQRHNVFAEEVSASEDLVKECLEDARRLVEAQHYASDEIQADAGKVKEEWEKLLEECKERGDKLAEACAEQTFNRSVTDLLRWIDVVNSALTSDDLGKDVDSVTSLIKKHQLLEVDVQVHKERVDGIEIQAKKFAEEKHFHSEAIAEKSDDVGAKYKALQDPIAARRTALDQSLRSKQLMWEMQDEVEWIQEKEPIAAATNLGKDLMSVKNLLKKHQILQSEIAAHESQIQDVQQQGKQLIDEGHFDSSQVETSSQKLDDEWKKLREAADQREQDLKDALEAHKYLANANDAQIWIEAKQAIVSSTDVGVDEDSAEALLKKHDSLQRDIDVYHATIADLHNEAEACKLQCPWAKAEEQKKVIVLSEYRKKTARELTVKKGDVLNLISNYNKNWWKVEREAEQGFVPANLLRIPGGDELQDDSDDEERVQDEVDGRNEATLLIRQKKIEADYEELKVNAVTRRDALERSRRRHALSRECDDMLRWIDERRGVAASYQPDDEGDGGLEEVEKLQKKLDEFQKDLKTREKQLNELNKEAKSLDLYPGDLRRGSVASSSSSSSESDHEKGGKTSDDAAVEDKVRELNQQWGSLHGLVKEQNENLGSAHQVQRFFRDADEAREWIEEKNQALDTDNVGSDLPTVQALQRKHEGLERDLAALGERVHALDADAARLTEQHPEQAEEIQRKGTEINQAWNDLVARAEARKRRLSDSYDLQHFLADRRDLEHWLDHMQTQVGSDEVADDISGAEALLQRHQDYRADIDSRAPAFHALEREADALVSAEHEAAAEVDAAIQETSRKREELEKAWATRRILLEQCLNFHVFLRDCENAEHWMQAREAFLASEEAGDSLDSVEALIKKHEDFDRAIGLQEAKISALQASAERLAQSDPPHYASDLIQEKAKAVQDRWEKLKAALIDKRSRLGENRTLQQFSRDADEAEAWIAEKLETAEDDSYKDPSHIQSKHQKHQAFEAELEANKDRIRAIIENGQQLIDTHQCAGSEVAVQERIGKLASDWDNLLSKSSEKGGKLREANQQQNFVTAVKDLDFWMSEVEALLASEDVGKDVPSVSNLLNKHKLLEADVAAHEDRAKELSKHAVSLMDKADSSDALDRDTVEAKRDAVEKRFAHVKELTKMRKMKLQESLRMHQFFYDVADEESWIGEKKILVTSEDYGRDLTSVNNLMKKQKRIEAEIGSHQGNVERLLTLAKQLKEETEWSETDINDRVTSLSSNWDSLKQLSEARNVRLQQAKTFQQFRADLEEESSWIQERLAVLEAQTSPDSLATAQSLLSKHETFETDLGVHRDRFADVRTTGQSLIDEGNPHAESIANELQSVGERLEKLESTSSARRNVLRDTWAFLQFNWKVDLSESVIDEKESLIKSDDYGDDLSAVQSLIVKQETFEAGLEAFEQESISKITGLKDQLVEAKHVQSDAIIERHGALMNRWGDLQATSAKRRDGLEKKQSHLRDIDDLCLLFAKKASAFNSWFENVEEDLTDPVRCHSIAEVQALLKEHEKFRETLVDAEKELHDLFDIDEKINKLRPPADNGAPSNSYTWFRKQTLQESWNAVKNMTQTREDDLQREMERQKENDQLRKKFAQYANNFHDWLTSTRATMMEESGTLESQLESIKQMSEEVKTKKTKLQEVEGLGATLEEALVLDNAYTEHSTVGLAQQWDQLEQLGMRMEHNLEQQIQARNMTGVTEDALKEFSMMFKHFDKDKTGRLEHHEFKSCLRSLGYDLPMVDEGEEDPEFQAILDAVDPNRDGTVSLQEYMGFMISRETENVKSSEEVESAFRALSAEGKPYVTKEELFQNLSKEQADYCVANMPNYYDSHGVHILGAYDYVAFTKELFNN